MPLFSTPYPHVTNSLNARDAPQPSFLVFYSSVDPSSGKMWCPDCRDVEKRVIATFDGQNKPKAMIHWVGQRAEWRDPKNEARVVWKVNNVPTILRIEHGKETGRLTEDEIMNTSKLEALLGNASSS